MKNLHLLISSIIVIPIAFVYGFLPEIFFDVALISIDESNIFKAIMGIYLGFGFFWLAGIFKRHYWKNATISNIIFMFGLGFGRSISLLIDGQPSALLIIGTIGEIVLGIHGIYILRKQATISD